MASDLLSINSFEQLLVYLAEELHWPIENYTIDELTFDYDAEELGLKAAEAAKLKSNTIRQLRPLQGQQPWGIFFIEFESKKLPIVVLRRILSSLALKKKASSNLAESKRWSASDILFISAFGESGDREMAFAHFHKDPDTSELPVLRVLGWDGGDRPLKLKQVDQTLRNRLCWPDNTDPEAWRAQWGGAFRNRSRHEITTAKELAATLAAFARRVRDAARTVMRYESETGKLRQLHRGFREFLIHDLSADDFATYYAETICYGLFTVAVSKTELADGKYGTSISTEDVAHFVPITNPFLKSILWSFLDAGGRAENLNFDDLGINEIVTLLNSDETNLPAVLLDFGNLRPGEDPVIHLYEDFLKQFDAELRKKRGVYYTPQPVVSYIVRSVHELLQTEFGLTDGLADTTTWGEMLKKHPNLKLPPLTDEPNEKLTISPKEPFVQILDPSTGTATFLVEVIEVIHRTLSEKWKQQHLTATQQLAAWNAYVPEHLLPRLHAFELMMAPYAIAHMKIGLKLAETGYRFGSEERARIYLSNALEPWAKQLLLIGFDALAHEAAAVNEIKRHKRFTVVIGNPPYSLVSANMDPTHRALVERYKFIEGERLRERGALQLEKILNDDYVKFIARSQDFLSATGAGILGFITNHAYLDNPTMRGLRHSFLASFRQGFFCDLGGSAKKAGKDTDENVFEIQQGVAICIALKDGTKSEQHFRHSKLQGLREAKYRVLSQGSVPATAWSDLAPSPPYFLFVPTDYELRAEYEEFVALADVFPLHSIGSFTSKDHFVISREPRDLVANAKAFRDSSLSNKELCNSLKINPKEAWNVSRSRDQIRKLSDKDITNRILQFIHRPFDSKYIFFHRSLVWSLAYPVNRNLVKKGNLALVTSRQLATPPWNHIFCSNTVVEMFLMSNKTKEGNHVFPLYIFPDEDSPQRSLGADNVRINFQGGFLKALTEKLQLPSKGPDGLPSGLTPEDIFHYSYAVYHSQNYRIRYAEFLKIDFPRLPLTGNLELFRALAGLGGELTALHLLESPELPSAITEFVGTDQLVSKVGWTKENGGTVWINAGGTKTKSAAGTSGFGGVPEKVWNFHLGCYQVCEKWLKDRKGQHLSNEDIEHYKKIVAALSETVRLMAEIDKVIEKHGGWPNAFAARTFLSSEA